jgi:hypothetical protein
MAEIVKEEPKKMLEDPAKIFERILHPPAPVFPEKKVLPAPGSQDIIVSFFDGETVVVPKCVLMQAEKFKNLIEDLTIKHSGEEGFTKESTNHLPINNDPNDVAADGAPKLPINSVYKQIFDLMSKLYVEGFPADFDIKEPPEVFKPIDITKLGPPPPIEPPPALDVRLTSWAKEWLEANKPVVGNVYLKRDEFFAFGNALDEIHCQPLLVLFTLANEAVIQHLDKNPDDVIQMFPTKNRAQMARENPEMKNLTSWPQLNQDEVRAEMKRQKEDPETALNPMATIAMRVFLGVKNDLTIEEQKKIIEENKWMGARPDMPDTDKKPAAAAEDIPDVEEEEDD